MLIALYCYCINCSIYLHKSKGLIIGRNCTRAVLFFYDSPWSHFQFLFCIIVTAFAYAFAIRSYTLRPPLLNCFCARIVVSIVFCSSITTARSYNLPSYSHTIVSRVTVHTFCLGLVALQGVLH